MEGGSGRRLASGRYALGELLGGGGTADVFRATDTVLSRQVAIKLFRAGTEVANKQRFEREARLLAPLNHPGLVMIYDAGVEESSVFLVLQLIDGVTLRQLISAGAVPSALVTTVGARLASVLEYVHRQGIVHRDMKPSNVLIDGVRLAPDASNVYLADFGISRLVDTSHLTATGMVVGTAAYMAPEQVMGRTVGPPADVYSLGLVLLEMLTSEQEYAGASAEAAVARLGRSPRIPPETPEPLRSALIDMTQTDPAARPAAATVAARLSGLGDYPARPGGPGPATGTVAMPGRMAPPPPGTALLPGAAAAAAGGAAGAGFPATGTRAFPGATASGAGAAASQTRALPAVDAGYGGDYGGGQRPGGPGGPGTSGSGGSGSTGGSQWAKALAVAGVVLVLVLGAMAAIQYWPADKRGGSITPQQSTPATLDEPTRQAPTSEPATRPTRTYAPSPIYPSSPGKPTPTAKPSPPAPTVEESPESDPGPAGPSPSAAQGLPGPVVSLSGPPARIADGKAGD